MSQKLSLVVVDDSEDVRRTVGRLLRSCGHDVRLFDSAEAYLGQQCPADCAVLDIQLPGISGLELEKRMRRERHQTAVVFITAHDDEPIRTAVGRTDCRLLTKPFDDDSLLSAIADATVRSSG